MLNQLKPIVLEAGKIIASARDVENTVHEKTGPRDLVTKYDLMVQEYLRRELLKLLPQAA